MEELDAPDVVEEEMVVSVFKEYKGYRMFFASNALFFVNSGHCTRYILY